MTDYEVLKEMLTKAGIVFDPGVEYDIETAETTTCFTIEDGYAGFEVRIDFDAAGNLTRMSAWE